MLSLSLSLSLSLYFPPTLTFATRLSLSLAVSRSGSLSLSRSVYNTVAFESRGVVLRMSSYLQVSHLPPPENGFSFLILNIIRLDLSIHPPLGHYGYAYLLRIVTNLRSVAPVFSGVFLVFASTVCILALCPNIVLLPYSRQLSV